MNEWRSRIVNRGTILASQITPHPNNPRRHPEAQRKVVEASFRELGQIAPIIININNGYLVDGEERSWLALDQSDDVLVECVWVDLTEAEHEKALLYLDASGDLATYDPERLYPLLADLQSDDGAIHQMLANLAAEVGSLIEHDPMPPTIPSIPSKTVKTCPHCGRSIDD